MSDLNTRNYEPHWPTDWDGLDYETAKNATPRLYGVSFGDGNDGVSHMFASYYVRTTDPWTLARAALIGQFKAEYQAQANEEMDVDGEADYTISACLYEPLNRDPPESNFECSDCGHAWSAESDSEDPCPKCGSDNIEDNGECEDSWCDANGAYMICEVFPIESDDDLSGSAPPPYDSLEDCFGTDAPELVMAWKE